MNQAPNKPQKVFLAFLDILGFKDLVSNNPVSILADIYEKSLLKMNNAILDFWNRDDFPDHIKNVKIQTLIISDSIIVYTERNDMASFLKILSHIHNLTAILFHEGLPIRGSLCFGDFLNLTSPGNNILLGKSIVKAFELEKKQDWSGCAVDDSCFNRFNLDTSSQSNFPPILRYFIPLIKYRVPLKNGSSNEMFVINWPMAGNDEPSGKVEFLQVREDIIIPAFSMHNKNVRDANIQTKIKNTLEFYHYSIKNTERKVILTPRPLTELFMKSFPHIE